MVTDDIDAASPGNGEADKPLAIDGDGALLFCRLSIVTADTGGGGGGVSTGESPCGTIASTTEPANAAPQFPQKRAAGGAGRPH